MRKMKKMRLLIVIAIALLPTSVYADNEQERAALFRLLNELEALTTMINHAEKYSQANARYQFHYPALRRDLTLIQQGVKEHLNRVRREPRTLPAIKGDYQRDQH